MENVSCKNVSVQFWESTLRDSLKGVKMCIRDRPYIIALIGVGAVAAAVIVVLIILRMKKRKKEKDYYS